MAIPSRFRDLSLIHQSIAAPFCFPPMLIQRMSEMSSCCDVRAIVASATLIVILGVAGCGAPAASVSGKVTFSGNEIDSGAIKFVSIGVPKGSEKAVTEDLRYGNYLIDVGRGVTAGKYKVEIYGNLKTAPLEGDRDMQSSSPEGAIPAKFNTESQLTVEIKGGENVFDFDLKP
jgi:hypothetical protein